MAGPRGRPAHRTGHHHHRYRLAGPLIRFLLITRRRIAAGRREAYARLWHDLRTAAERAGAHAWIFESNVAADTFVEFIEWKSDAAHAIIERDDVAAAFEQLNEVFPFEDSETWKEAEL